MSKSQYRCAFISILLAFFLPPNALPSQPSHDEIQKGIDLSMEEDYDIALSCFAELKEKYPDHPAGAFFSAAVWQSRMMDFESRRWEKAFFREIEQAIQLAKAGLKKNAQDAEMHFFYGGALGYKSFQLGLDKKYLSSIKIAMSSIRELKRAGASDSSFCDPLLGIGTYQYWRSQITRNFSWLPFFPNHREKGIALIHKALDCGVFSRWAALSNLAWIYIEEGDCEAAIECAREGLARFPHSRFFLWPLAEAQFKRADFSAAIATYARLLESVTQESINNHYNEIVLHWKLAQCHFKLRNYAAAQESCDKILSIVPDQEVKGKAKDKIEAAKKLQKEIRAKLQLAN